MSHCLTIVGLLTAAAAQPAGDKGRLPADLPPVVATATATEADDPFGGPEKVLKVRLIIPRMEGRTVGEVVPKRDWPRVDVTVTPVERTITLGGADPTALAPSRVLGADGRDLPRAEVLRRLQAEAPVLLSVTGKMVDPYYLRVSSKDVVIVVLGPRDGSPAPELLPAARPRDTGPAVLPSKP
jgi:hypothetical protein